MSYAITYGGVRAGTSLVKLYKSVADQQADQPFHTDSIPVYYLDMTSTRTSAVTEQIISKSLYDFFVANPTAVLTNMGTGPRYFEGSPTVQVPYATFTGDYTFQVTEEFKAWVLVNG